jgi:hypothetical protein
MPIQFRAGRDPGAGAAVFSEGSSGEYEASARKRRAAETNSSKPISSFSRRLVVGVNAREKYFMGNDKPPRHHASANLREFRQSKLIMPETAAKASGGVRTPNRRRLTPIGADPM